jgi:hypothetical protein
MTFLNFFLISSSNTIQSYRQYSDLNRAKKPSEAVLIIVERTLLFTYNRKIRISLQVIYVVLVKDYIEAPSIVLLMLPFSMIFLSVKFIYTKQRRKEPVFKFQTPRLLQFEIGPTCFVKTVIKCVSALHVLCLNQVLYNIIIAF